MAAVPAEMFTTTILVRFGDLRPTPLPGWLRERFLAALRPAPPTEWPQPPFCGMGCERMTASPPLPFEAVRARGKRAAAYH